MPEIKRSRADIARVLEDLVRQSEYFGDVGTADILWQAALDIRHLDAAGPESLALVKRIDAVVNLPGLLPPD